MAPEVFDPGAYRIVLSIHGVRRSSRMLARPTQARQHTTSNLIVDIELLRQHLDIDRWLVLGVLGRTLASPTTEHHGSCHGADLPY